MKVYHNYCGKEVVRHSSKIYDLLDIEKIHLMLLDFYHKFIPICYFPQIQIVAFNNNEIFRKVGHGKK